MKEQNCSTGLAWIGKSPKCYCEAVNNLRNYPPVEHVTHTLVTERAMPAEQLYGVRTPSEREKQVIALVAQGLKNGEIAEAIGASEHAVKNHLRVIYDKLGLWNRVELAL